MEKGQGNKELTLSQKDGYIIRRPTYRKVSNTCKGDGLLSEGTTMTSATLQASPVCHANLDATGRDLMWPLGSGCNPIPPSDFKPGWDSDAAGNGVVHGDIGDFAATGRKNSR